MRKLVILVSILSLTMNVSQAQNPQKRKARISYIHKTAKLSKAEQDKISKTLTAFLDAKHDSKEKHEEVKDKYASADDRGKLTPSAANELMLSKFAKQERDIAIERKYYAEFKSLIGAVKAREIIKCADDKLK